MTMHRSIPNPLPDFVLALPGLLHGNLAQAAEVALDVDADGALACECAEWLVMKEVCPASSYSNLERHRIMKIGNLCKDWLASSLANIGLSVWKVKFVYAIASVISCCDPAESMRLLANARFCLIMLRERCCQTIVPVEEENVA